MYRVTTRGQPLVGSDGSTSSAISGRPILEVSDELSVGLWKGVEMVDRDSNEAKAQTEAAAKL